MSQMSNVSSVTYSVSSSSSRQTNISIQESSAKTYLIELEKYLTSILEKEAQEGVPTQRSAARQKLSRLNNLQFHELATDVYDELIRRTSNHHKSFLPIRDEYHPRRNQARQKLATLPSTRFKDLASDVYHELKRRYPHINTHPLSQIMEAQGLPSQSTNIIPVKGMMSVESMDFSDNEEDSGQLTLQNPSLNNLMEDLGNMVKSPQPNNSNEMTDKMKQEYENRIESMEKQIKMLELSLDNEINSPNNGDMDKERQMRMKQMHEEYKKLDNRFNQLNIEHAAQQQAVHDVKREMKTLIDELKALSNKNEILRLQNEKSMAEIRELTQENKSWKRKYETVSMELRSFKVASVNMDNEELAKEFFLKPNPQGAIGQQFVIEYQTAIDDLMKTSRSSKPSDVLFSMRNIVMACKSITAEVEDYEVKIGLSAENQEALYDIKRRFTNELTNLLAATKSFAGGMGISPVSLVDASAGNLTGTIVDLIRLLGMRPIHPIEEGIQSLSVLKTSSKIHEKASIQTEKTYMAPADLSEFLKIETNHIVSSVQNLLAALRSNNGQLFEIITSIVNIVSNIINTSSLTFSRGEGLKYKIQGTNILNDLTNCNQKIIQTRDSAFKSNPENANAAAKRNLAQESYEIAKYTKELINMLDT